MKNKNKTKERISLSSRIGLASMALLFGLAERGASTLADLLNLNDSKMGMAGALMKELGKKNFWDYYRELKELQENSARTILWRLQKKGLVEKKKDRYLPTIKGLNFIKNFQEKKSEKTWDNKWRLVMFDIPENKKTERNWLRRQLFRLDYRPLQKSIFIGKYPLEETLFQQIIGLDLHRYLRLITIGEIDDENNLPI